MFKNKMGDKYGFECRYVLSPVLRYLAFQCGCVGTVDRDGSLGVVCGNGAVVYQVVGEYVFEVLLGGASEFYI